MIGHILKGRREKLFIATKVNNIDPAVIRSSIDEVCNGWMQIDHVDL